MDRKYELKICSELPERGTDYTIYAEKVGDAYVFNRYDYGQWHTVDLKAKSVDTNAYSSISKIQEYLYEVQYDDIDYDYAYSYFRTRNDYSVGACSSVRKGNKYGRNLDWTYDNGAEFIVRTSAKSGRNAVLGVAGAISDLTDTFVESGERSEAYKIVPFMLQDGINEYGLVCNTNVVPNDYGDTTGTNPDKPDICSLMLPRYILDHFKTADEAVAYIRDELSVYVPNRVHDMGYETHLMIADKTKTYVVEFIYNETIITDVTEHPYMTNFFIYGLNPNDDGTVNTIESEGLPSSNGITDYGSGLERYNLIVSNYADSEVSAIMEALTYTNSYKRSTTPFWYSEFVGGPLTVDSTADEFEFVVYADIYAYEHRSRTDETKTWQTTHSSVYDMDNLSVDVIAQENGISYTFGFNYYTKYQIDEMILGHLIPSYSDADNGKVLKVVNGQPTWVAE